MRVAVAGGGIAGLTAALALAARGIEVALFERAAMLAEIGAGIQLSPNAMAVLERLGVARHLAGRVCEPRVLSVRDGRSGALLAEVPLAAAMRARHGAPYLTLLRSDLQAALLARAQEEPGIALHLQADVRDVRAAPTGVVFVAGGQSRRADILVGADGIHSHIRVAHFGHPGPHPLRRTAWRATVPRATLERLVPLDVTGLWLGAGGHLVHYAVDAGARINVVVVATDADAKPPLLPFGAATRTIIESVFEWTSWPLARVDPIRAWARGRVVLVGDAAHAMAPSAAQGGAMAIEDAWVLAATLAGAGDDPASMLSSYERQRRPRVERVARTASRNLRLYELNGAAAFMRNAALNALPASVMLRRLDWLFRGPAQM